MNHIFTLLLVIVLTAGQIVFLPTQYSTIKPWQFDIERRTFALSMQLCTPAVYTGCQMTASINLPFTDWAVEDGTYANFTITSEADLCTNIICQNDAKGANPNRCTFVYDPKFGGRLYAAGTAGNAGGFQATYNLEINCTKRENPEWNVKYGVSGLAACPANADTTKRTINFNTPGRVKTSPRTADAVKYEIAVCPDKQVFAKIVYSVQAVDRVSAFASYFCSTTPCNVDVSPIGWYDDSGTALNAIAISNLKNQMVWFDIYGWGQFNGFNSYVFNLEINDV